MADRAAATPDTPLVLEAGAIRLEVLRRGASVRRLLVPDARGVQRNVVLGYAESSGYGAQGHYFGATIGRYANRLAQGRFTLDGTPHDVPANEGPHALHGGPDGWDRRDWHVVDQSDQHVRFALDSPDGDQGFPGELHVEAGYRVEEGTVRLDYVATTDRATVVSLTNHSYFNLDGEDAGSVDGHLLTVHADSYTPTDGQLIPTGELARVEGTPFDWRAAQPLGPRIREGHPQLVLAKGLDHNFVLRVGGLRHVATLESVRSGIRLEVDTDRPGLQVYTGNFLDGTTEGTSGRRYRQGDGIALETQSFPDAPNRPAFPSTELRPGEVYRSRTVWRFGTTG